MGTNTDSLEIVKLIINACFDVANCYLGTPLDHPKYVKSKLPNIPLHFIHEYNLTKYKQYGWIHFKIRKGFYGLPQSGKLANDQLRNRLEREGYYETTTTTDLWRHRWRLILFIIVFDDFGVKYFVK